MPNPGNATAFGPVIFAYTRAQAIEDGILVDVSETAREAGFKIPVAVTRTVWDRIIALPEGYRGFQDERGRLWDVLWMARHYALHRDLPVRPALGVPFQRQQKLAIPVPRTRPDRGAGTPDQTSSIRTTSRTSSSPPPTGNAPPPGIRTWTATPPRSIFRSSAPSPSLSPDSDAAPTDASAASGSPSGLTMPSDIAIRAQKGEIGRSA